MTQLAPDYAIDTKPLHQLEETLNSLQKISEQTKTRPEDLFDLYERTSAKLQRIRNGSVQISKLGDLLEESKIVYRKHAHILSEMRTTAGKALSAAITAELPPLKLMRAEFEAQVRENPAKPWTELGLDEVFFTARLNPGMPFSMVSETASGGELARLILALKVILQRVQTIPTLVFDEVDAGIGGAAAAAVGERLALLAETTQVLVITHSPQVASRGDQHLHVSKKTDSISTISIVKGLSPDERIDEISHMLAGETITPHSHAAAKSLLEEAGRAAESRRG
jgi:DNA repair protein RecN (Recombination protein N)